MPEPWGQSLPVPAPDPESAPMGLGDLGRLVAELGQAILDANRNPQLQELLGLLTMSPMLAMAKGRPPKLPDPKKFVGGLPVPSNVKLGLPRYWSIFDKRGHRAAPQRGQKRPAVKSVEESELLPQWISGRSKVPQKIGARQSQLGPGPSEFVSEHPAAPFTSARPTPPDLGQLAGTARARPSMGPLYTPSVSPEATRTGAPPLGPAEPRPTGSRQITFGVEEPIGSLGARAGGSGGTGGPVYQSKFGYKTPPGQESVLPAADPTKAQTLGRSPGLLDMPMTPTGKARFAGAARTGVVRRVDPETGERTRITGNVAKPAPKPGPMSDPVAYLDRLYQQQAASRSLEEHTRLGREIARVTKLMERQKPASPP